MADKQPVALRIVRPYESEAEFLEQELDTLTRTTVLLLGAQQRPEGVVLRFEVSLASGATLIRGEGRVVGYKANALKGEPGLMMRFTRLDSKSKALVDRAAAMRDDKRGARTSIAPPPPAPPHAPPHAPPPAPSSGGPVIADDSVEIPAVTVEVQAVTESVSASEPASAPEPVAAATGTAVAPVKPADRESVLERLRARARTLDRVRVDEILRSKPKPA